MAKVLYVGTSDKARRVKKLFVGIDGKARKVKKAYIGVGNKARLFFNSETLYKGLSLVSYNTSSALLTEVDINKAQTRTLRVEKSLYYFTYGDAYLYGAERTATCFHKIDPTSGSVIQSSADGVSVRSMVGAGGINQLITSSGGSLQRIDTGTFAYTGSAWRPRTLDDIFPCTELSFNGRYQDDDNDYYGYEYDFISGALKRNFQFGGSEYLYPTVGTKDNIMLARVFNSHTNWGGFVRGDYTTLGVVTSAQTGQSTVYRGSMCFV